MRCTIWYHLYNLKNMKNTHGGVLLLEANQIAPKVPNRTTHDIYLHGPKGSLLVHPKSALRVNLRL